MHDLVREIFTFGQDQNAFTEHQMFQIERSCLRSRLCLKFGATLFVSRFQMDRFSSLQKNHSAQKALQSLKFLPVYVEIGKINRPKTFNDESLEIQN